jgi:hypothetical protein
VNDESMTVLRLAAEEPRIPIWATIDFPPVRHRFSCFALSIPRAGGGAMTKAGIFKLRPHPRRAEFFRQDGEKIRAAIGL